MNRFALFTDMSLHPQKKLGVGAWLVIAEAYLAAPPGSSAEADIAGQVQTRRFEDTSSAQLELQTVLWALEEHRNRATAFRPEELTVYSDAQCVTGLLKRRTALERRSFLSRRTNRLLGNAVLYRKFYALYDQCAFTIIPVKGHSPSCSHDTVHRIFSLVDRRARHELQQWMGEL
jgi:ribonuclease HI